MELSFSTILTLSLLSLVLLANNGAYGRKDRAGEYWKEVTNDQPMPEAIKALILHEDHQGSSLLPAKQEADEIVVLEFKNNKKDKPLNRHGESKSFAKDFDPRPNISIYHGGDDNDDEKKEGKTSDCMESKSENDEKKGTAIAKDFEPVPDVTIYHN